VLAGRVLHRVQQLLPHPVAARLRDDEEAGDLSGPGWEQAQARAADDRVVPAGQQEQAVRRAEVSAGLGGHRGPDLARLGRALVVPADDVAEVGREHRPGFG
jgi:hypothetical protein